jgi:hypothetical protein
VLGQPDMNSNTRNNGGVSARSLSDPGRGWWDGERLFVPDIGNHRVLIWSGVPAANGAPADLVLGQPDMTSAQPNAGGAVSAAGLDAPIAVYATGKVVAVAEYNNHRVLVWTSALAASGQAADVVIGQPGPTANAANNGGLTAASLQRPNAVAGDGTRLFVSDRFNHRILMFPAVPGAHGASATLALGQPDLVSGRPNNPGPVTATSLSLPASIARLGPRFAVADSDNNRVLVWDAPPASRQDAPQIVLGQPDFTSFAQFGGAASARSLCVPWRVHSDGARLFVGEQCASRVGIWTTLPTVTHQPLDLALGQPDLVTSTQNTGGRSASSLSIRPQPWSDGQRLFVADALNHRVLVWNAMPATTGRAADLVLGQPDMTSSGPNNGGLGAGSLAFPNFAYASRGKLFVADTNNNRVLVWNAIPTANRAAADLVLGQPDMTSSAPAAPSARTLSSPRAVHVDADGRLYVVDAGNNRVLYWNAIPTQSQAPADGVIGQPALDAGLANNGGLGARTLQDPNDVLAAGDRVYVADMGNNRILVLPRP